MNSRAVVEALPAPAVLVGQDLRALAASLRWRELYGDAFTPFVDEPFRSIPGAQAAARGAIESGLAVRLATSEGHVVSEVEHFDVRPVLARGTDRLAVVAGLLVVGHERETAPSAAAAFRLRSGLQDLVVHLEALQASALTDLQADRMGQAIETALGLVTTLAATKPDRPEAPNEPAVRPPLRSPDAPPLRVLIVDDNSINRHVAQSMFGVLGIAAEAVGDAEGALAMLEASPYHLVFMDVMLPGVDGPEVTQRIRQRAGPQPYVVGVTAMPEAEARCLAAGMDAFVVKPLRLDDVVRAVALCDEAEAGE